MPEQYLYRETIPPVPTGIHRPLWSVMIPTYNCAHYLRETLASVLAQDLGPELMQIEVIDDCSTKDNPEAVVAELGKGRVSFYRQPNNVGHVKNFETCLQRSRGQLIHQLHGDDCVCDRFYRKLEQAFESNPGIGAAFCRHIFMDEYGHWQRISPLEQSESGVLENWLETIAAQQRIQTPSIVVRREVYEKLGGFDRRLIWCEDWEMWVRIAAYYETWYEAEPLALYRQHSNSSTSRVMRTGENVRDFRRAIDIVRDYLPVQSVSLLSKAALRDRAFCALNDAESFALSGDKVAALNQVQEALRCNSQLSVIRYLVKLILRMLYRKAKSNSINSAIDGIKFSKAL
jgi:GT2 family glycosyltransferase